MKFLRLVSFLAVAASALSAAGYFTRDRWKPLVWPEPKSAEKHAEFTVDHKTKSAKFYILGPDAKRAAPVKAASVKLSINKPAFEADLKAEKQAGGPD